MMPASDQNLVSPLTIQEYNDAFAAGWWFWNGQENVLDEGWKLNVRCNVENAAVILSLVLPKLREGNFAYKFLLTPYEVENQNNTPEQAVKVLAVYPQNIFEAFDIAGVIDNALINGSLSRCLAGDRQRDPYWPYRCLHASRSF